MFVLDAVSKMTSNGVSKVNATPPIDPRDLSGPKNPSDQFFWPQLPGIHHPSSSLILEYKVNMVLVSVPNGYLQASRGDTFFPGKGCYSQEDDQQ